jgi:hypothetical protein
MSTEAHDLHRRILLACGKGDTRLFRNNTGQGWVGEASRWADGLVVIKHARPFHAGLCQGSSDLIGWRSVVVTPDMVGQTVAVFVAIEAKTGSGRPSEAQRLFLAAVKGAGGIAGIARSPEDAELLLHGK